MFEIPIDEYLAIASVVLNVDVASILRTTDLGLADSALHAPFAGFGDMSSTRQIARKPVFSWSDSSRTIHLSMATNVRPC
ncbi:MAG: hypothetical protein IIC71_05320 [Acidobacteria bacterium]|nr:hypothetical protein [Acidobacteriota bacterium]